MTAPELRPPAPTTATITVRIPGPLRTLAASRDEVRVEAATVREALDRLLDRHPGLRRHLRTEDDALREHVNVFVNQDDIRYLAGEATPLGDGDALTIVPSIAGG